MTAAITFLAFIAIAIFIFVRMIRSRDANPEYENVARPQRTSRRERKLEKMREFEESIPPRPTIQELMQQEVEATGVDRIAGGDGVEIPVLLKVWHRDAHVRAGCSDTGLRYVVSEGVEPSSATIDDVMLVCDVPNDAAGESPGDHHDAAEVETSASENSEPGP